MANIMHMHKNILLSLGGNVKLSFLLKVFASTFENLEFLYRLADNYCACRWKFISVLL
jgi:hypothetical protein